MNVSSNALKYTKTGYIDVTLRMLEDQSGGPRHICLSVVDTGVGMSEEFLKYHLFTPFMQECNLTPGTGLGLSLVKNIVESLGGNISVESRSGEGTRVAINVPLDEALVSLDRSNVDKTFIPQNRLRGLTLRLISIASNDPSTPRIPHIVLPPRVLERSIRNICEGNFGMTVTTATTSPIPKTDFLVINTHRFNLKDEID